MDQVVLLCVDGSEDSVQAAATGLARLAPGARVVVATVVEGGDPTLVTGVGGMAAGALTAEQLAELDDHSRREGEKILTEALAELGLAGAEHVVLQGEAGMEIVLYATELGATVVVVGSHGRGGIKRVLLGSVSDHVVRNAPCPVLVVREAVED